MQKGFSIVFILIGIAIIATGVGGAYYFGKLPVKPAFREPKVCTQDAKQCPDGSYVSRTGPNCEFKKCPKASPSSSGESADWKVYSNTKFKYAFRYPGNWKLNIHGDDGISLSSPDLGYSEQSGYPESGAEINIDVEGTNLRTLDEVYEQILIDKFVKVLEREDIFIGGKKALRLEVNALEAPKGLNIYILEEGNMYNLQFWQIENNYGQIFEKILSTFKFLDSSEDANLQGEFCGGFAGKECPLGYTCILDGKYPDAGGKCAKD